MKTNIDIGVLEATAEEIRKVALKTTESYKLLLEAIEILKGEDNEVQARNETDAAVHAGGETVHIEEDGSMPHEGRLHLRPRQDGGGVRGGGKGVETVSIRAEDIGADSKQNKNRQGTPAVVIQHSKPLKIASKDRQRVCEVCGRAFTWGESGFKKSCSQECETERRRRLMVERARKRREVTASVWSEPLPRKPSKLDKKLKALDEAGVSYADQQKNETIEKFARIEI